MAPSDTTDVERVEILKGPSSVLYGRAASGGIVTLITKEPLPVEHGVVSVQTDRYGSVRPTIRTLQVPLEVVESSSTV